MWQDQKNVSHVPVSSVSVWMCSLEPFQTHQPEDYLCLFLLKQEPQMQGNIIFSLSAIFHGFVKCDLSSMIFFTAHPLFFVWDELWSRCLPVFGHSRSSFMSHVSSIWAHKVLLLKMLFKPNAGILHNFRVFQAVFLENNDSIIYESISFWLILEKNLGPS